jgi:eukaryotic-like serine/threonine-protein kinase
MTQDSIGDGPLADAAIFEYLTALDVGQPCDIEAWLARYPSVREELLQFLDDQALACNDAVLPTPGAGLTAADPEATADFAGCAVAPLESAASTLKAGSPSVVKEKPQVVGGIRLGKLLGAGGMGRVYEGRDAANQPVAVKLLAPNWTGSEELINRFRQEGELASVINHPRCVFIRSADTDNGVPYIVMELMPGDTLKDLVTRRGPVPYREAVQLILDVAEGLEEAHSRGMIHRDVKPANCYLEADGRVKIGDFGLARSVVQASELTVTGGFVGTPLYASPEQICGRTLDARTDIYSLAATLFYVLSGRAPFSSENATQTIARIVSEDPPSVRQLVPDVPQGLDVALLKGLAREPGARFQSIVDFRNALLPFMSDGPVSAPLGIRLLAMLVDLGLFSLVFTFFSLMANPRAMFLPDAKAFWYVALGGPAWFLYLFLQEWRGGATVGKRLLRLRVVDANTLGSAACYRHLIRSACFVLLTGYLPEFYQLMSAGSDAPLAVAWYAVGLLAGYALILITYRVRREGTLLHDWLGGCRVVNQPAIAADHPCLDVSDAWIDTPAKLATDTQPLIGRFQILASVSDANNASNGKRVLLAKDKKLDRNVWLITPTESRTAEMIEDYANLLEEKSQSRTTRLRRIERVRADGIDWDAFMAIDGESVEQLIARQSNWTWSQVRTLLDQLSVEADAVEQSGTSLRIYSLAQLWVDKRGRLVILDFPLNPLAQPSPLPLPILTVAHALTHGLLAHDRQVSSNGTHSLPPIPAHATRMIDAMQGGRVRQYASVAAFRQDLEQTRRAATTVGIKHRMVQIALMSILASGVYGAGLSLSRIGNQIGIVHAADALLTASFARQLHTDNQLYAEWKELAETDTRRPPLTEIPPQARLADLADALDRKFADEFVLRYQHSTFLQRMMFEPGPYQARLLQEREHYTWKAPGESSKAYEFTLQSQASGLSTQIRVADITAYAMARELAEAETMERSLPRRWQFLLFLAASPVLLTMLWDVVFRGGWCAWLAGIRYVDGRNRKVGFLRFALRVLVLWSPAIGLVFAVAILDMRPEPSSLQAAEVLNAIYLMLPLPYMLLTLLYPRRGWHDRLVGTYPVPR